ncbi:hypothetical protein K438DRAFT_1764759 [Mycena galopus ATCC 62051]|nr:hypothetical protein K438DRAFT_1764759 [Mycena galopus ATCC 62051]
MAAHHSAEFNAEMADSDSVQVQPEKPEAKGSQCAKDKLYVMHSIIIQLNEGTSVHSAFLGACATWNMSFKTAELAERMVAWTRNWVVSTCRTTLPSDYQT